jgi:Family of unknown function (DUF6325)
MDVGPVEILMVEFPGNKFTGEIAPALAELVDQGTLRVIDLLFVTKDGEGNVAAIELSDADDAVRSAFSPIVEEASGLLSEEDIEDLGEGLDPDSSAAMLLFEHVWATRFRDAIVDSGGELLARVPIPKEVVDEVVAARETA